MAFTGLFINTIIKENERKRQDESRKQIPDPCLLHESRFKNKISIRVRVFDKINSYIYEIQN